jgi:hypothetical protein
MPKYDEMLKANLEHLLQMEETDPKYYGARIADICERLGC